MKIEEKYTVCTTEVPSKPGCWSVLIVSIFQDHGEGRKEKIGEYERNYSSLFNTFVPFVQNGKEYALYSKEYTATRVMSLPDCKDVCGEEQNSWGFCPVEYYVPLVDCRYDEEGGRLPAPVDANGGRWGFVAGCVWGDDCSWKIQVLDLRRLSEGILIRDEKNLGYVEMLGKHKLKDAIDLEYWELDDEFPHITIACRTDFWLGQTREERSQRLNVALATAQLKESAEKLQAALDIGKQALTPTPTVEEAKALDVLADEGGTCE